MPDTPTGRWVIKWGPWVAAVIMFCLAVLTILGWNANRNRAEESKRLSEANRALIKQVARIQRDRDETRNQLAISASVLAINACDGQKAIVRQVNEKFRSIANALDPTASDNAARVVVVLKRPIPAREC